MAAIDFTPTGATFSRLTVVSAPFKSEIRRWTVLCRCSCGTEKPIQAKHLVSGATVSCGCVRRGLPNDKNRKHGHSGGGKKASPTYMSWTAAKSRCYDAKGRDYANYGGRGIVMCDRWRDSFETFLADMGARPDGLTLDRWPNTDGNYEPGNCRWATPVEQGNNRRTNFLIKYKGEMRTCSEIAKEAGLPPSAFIGRIRRGWSVERAAIEPIKTK